MVVMADKEGRYGVVRVPTTVDRARSKKFKWLVSISSFTHARCTGEYIWYVVHSHRLPMVSLNSDIPEYVVCERDNNGVPEYFFERVT